MNQLLECCEIRKNYGTRPALNGINLTLPRGKIIGLLGPNGSGKTTLIKLATGLLVPTEGEILVDGVAPGAKSKAVVSYLPERTYLSEWMTAGQVVDFFADFYQDFDKGRALNMLNDLGISTQDKIKAMSKGTKEKVQLILVMSRNAQLYLLDEPIGGVDPAARDYILRTILTNYNEEASVVISTHLIADIERILDEVVFINQGRIVTQASVDDIREKEGKSVDELFREVFRC